MNDRRVLGQFGEDAAAAYFQGRGYRILERNYRCRLGEIDLVAEKEGRIIFVEVKTRSSMLFGAPEESVNERKKRKLWQLAECYLKERALEGREAQFDVLSVYCPGPECEKKIEHFENALQF